MCLSNSPGHALFLTCCSQQTTVNYDLESLYTTQFLLVRLCHYFEPLQWSTSISQFKKQKSYYFEYKSIHFKHWALHSVNRYKSISSASFMRPCFMTFALPHLTELQFDIDFTFIWYANVVHKYRLLELGWAWRGLGRINYAHYVIEEVILWSHNINNQQSMPMNKLLNKLAK